MSVNGQLELMPYEEKRFDFLILAVVEDEDEDFNRGYTVSARVADDASEKKDKDWKCDVIVGKSCVTCGHECLLKQALPVVLTNHAPSSFLYASPSGCRCEDEYHQRIKSKFLIFIFLHDQTMSKPDAGLKFEDKKFRFTDQGEAQKLRYNCQVVFENSDQPVYVNRDLLAIYSNVFNVMFKEDFKEKNATEITLGVDREGFLAFLDCLYSPSAPVTMDNFKAVVWIADRYDCPHLIEECKKLAQVAAKTLSTVEECRDFIAIAEHLGWEHVVTAVIDSMKARGVKCFSELLDYEWMSSRKKSTVHYLFVELKSLLPSCAIANLPKRGQAQFKDTTSRFTDEAKAKKLNANLKILFEESDEPAYVSRELLFVYSNFFRTIFEGDFKEKEIKLDVKREYFLKFMDCLLFPTAPLTAHNFKAVLMVAKRYDCPQVFFKCKDIAAKEASKAASVEDCMDYLEVAEFLGWNDLTVIGSMKLIGASIFMELLESDWINERNPSTQQALFVGLKEVVML